MRDVIFSSILASPMARFVAIKQQSCTDYYSQARLLFYLDEHLRHSDYDQNSLTPAIVSSYLGTLTHLAPRSFSNRYSVIRQFSIYLQQDYEQSYVLARRPFVGRAASRPAYIYTVDQMAQLLNTSRFSSPQQAVPGLYQTLFSLLYTTGIRIGEAMALNHGDYLSTERLLHIRCGKFRKESAAYSVPLICLSGVGLR